MISVESVTPIPSGPNVNCILEEAALEVCSDSSVGNEDERPERVILVAELVRPLVTKAKEM